MKKSNKGFSLVELIIVIAIMAILIAVLAPQYLKYVEKTKKNTDAKAFGEVVQAAEVAIADPILNPTSSTVTVKWDGNNFSVTGSKLQAEVNEVINGKSNDSKLVAKSKAFKKGDSEVTFTIDTNGNWSKTCKAGTVFKDYVSY